MLQRARRKSETPRPAAGFALLKQKVTQLEEKQRHNNERCLEALRHHTQAYQGGEG